MSNKNDMNELKISEEKLFLWQQTTSMKSIYHIIKWFHHSKQVKSRAFSKNLYLYNADDIQKPLEVDYISCFEIITQ